MINVNNLLLAEDLDAMPGVEWLIENEIPYPGYVVLYGQSGVGKSFIALDYALRIAQHHNILYVAGERWYTIKDRKNAWVAYNRHDTNRRAYIYKDAVNLLEEDDIFGFIDLARPIEPRFIIFDTLATCSIGGNENSARDMGILNDSISKIRTMLNTTVLVVHHTGKDGNAERGSSALRAAADVMIKVNRDDDAIEVECTKMSDTNPFHTYRIVLQPVDNSLVVVKQLDTREKIVGYVQEVGSARIKDIERDLGISQATIYRVKDELPDKLKLDRGVLMLV